MGGYDAGSWDCPLRHAINYNGGVAHTRPRSFTQEGRENHHYLSHSWTAFLFMVTDTRTNKHLAIYGHGVGLALGATPARKPRKEGYTFNIQLSRYTMGASMALFLVTSIAFLFRLVNTTLNVIKTMVYVCI